MANMNGQQDADPNAQGAQGQVQEPQQTQQTPSGTVTPPVQQTQQTQQAAQTGPPAFTADYIKGLREENAEWRIKFSKSEQDRADLEQKLKKMQADLEETALNDQIRAVAGELKLIDDVDGIKRFLDPGKLKRGQDGKFENLKAELEELVKARPYLGSGTTVPAQQNKPTPPTNPPRTGQIKLSHEVIEKMSSAEIEENWTAIQAFLSGNN